MKLIIDADEVEEIIKNVIAVKGMRAISCEYKSYGHNFEVTFEKSPVDQGLIYRAQDQMDRAAADGRMPSPTTPPFVPYDYSPES